MSAHAVVSNLTEKDYRRYGEQCREGPAANLQKSHEHSRSGFCPKGEDPERPIGVVRHNPTTMEKNTAISRAAECCNISRTQPL
jgi:hypothetical protein